MSRASIEFEVVPSLPRLNNKSAQALLQILLDHESGQGRIARSTNAFASEGEATPRDSGDP